MEAVTRHLETHRSHLHARLRVLLGDGAQRAPAGTALRVALTRPLPRLVSLVAALLVLAGGLLTRWLVVEAGKLSADDPAAYFAYTSSDSSFAHFQGGWSESEARHR